jgi:hypothetical protein
MSQENWRIKFKHTSLCEGSEIRDQNTLTQKLSSKLQAHQN